MALAKTVHNSPVDLVDESLHGYLLTRPDLVLVHPYEQRIVARRRIDPEKVSVICGGGAGHEPAHVGFVGEGMLTVAVVGGIFSSPTVAAVETAILHGACPLIGRKECLLVVKNYTGDRLAFAAAAEKARAHGVRVEVVYVCDDVALEGGAVIGRRGLAGAVLVYKVAGALAESGAPLDVVARAARAVAEGCLTFGASLTVCDIPGRVPSDRLAGSAVELGLGIHGEPGAVRLETVPSANALCGMMLEKLASRYSVGPVLLLINSYGGLSPLEQGGVVRAAVEWFSSHPALSLQRLVVGTLMTSLSMRGFSFTLLPLNLDVGSSLTLEDALDAPGTVAWPPCTPPPRGATCITLDRPIAPPLLAVSTAGQALEAGFAALPPSEAAAPLATLLLCALESAAAALLAAEGTLNALDAKVGDGDTGATCAAMARAALAYVVPTLQRAAATTSVLSGSSTATRAALMTSHALCRILLPALLADIGDALSSCVGGSSGLLYTLMLRATSVALQQQSGAVSVASACTSALLAVGGAANSREGQRSMLDALGPAARALEAVHALNESALDSVARAVRSGAEATADMVPVAGRSCWVKPEVAKGVQDPGAAAAAVWVCAVVEALKAFLAT